MNEFLIALIIIVYLAPAGYVFADMMFRIEGLDVIIASYINHPLMVKTASFAAVMGLALTPLLNAYLMFQIIRKT
jgi:hypothetical protein